MTRARELAKLGNPNVITVDASNNIGIGSTTPDAKLDVGGAFIVGSGASITEDGEAVFSGVCTAVGLNVTGSDVSGVGTQGLNIEATGAVVSGVSTFYGDTNVGSGITLYPAAGIVSCAQVTVRTGGLSVDGQANLDELVVAGVATFSAAAYPSIDVDGQVNLDEVVVAGVATFSAYPALDANEEVQVGASVQLGLAGIVTAVGLDIATGGVDIDGQLDVDELVVAGVSTFSAAIDANVGANLAGGLTVDQVNCSGVSTFAGILTCSSHIYCQNQLHVSGIGSIGSNATGWRTIQSGGSASGGHSGDIYYIY